LVTPSWNVDGAMWRRAPPRTVRNASGYRARLAPGALPRFEWHFPPSGSSASSCNLRVRPRAPQHSSRTCCTRRPALFEFRCLYADCDGRFDLTGAVNAALAGPAHRAEGALECAGKRARHIGSKQACQLHLIYTVIAALQPDAWEPLPAANGVGGRTHHLSSCEVDDEMVSVELCNRRIHRASTQCSWALHNVASV